MDASTLRIVLIVLGGALLIGMYLWERRRAASEDDEEWPTQSTESPSVKREPRLGSMFGRRRPDGDGGSASEDDDRQSRRDFDEYPDDAVGAPSARTGTGASAQTATARSVDNYGASDNPPTELLVQFFVVNADHPFEGAALGRVADMLNLTPGEMQIYHRQADAAVGHEPLFSMANVVNPGTFPFAAMDGFSTPGVALFAQFRGDQTDLMVFDEMLQAARTLADDLSGEVQRQTREPLSIADAEELRDRVLDLVAFRTSGIIAN